MYELIRAAENTYYIDGPTKLGIFLRGDDAYLIDGGDSNGAAKRVLKHLSEQDWHLSAIFCTHSHADHNGGNALLQEELGVPIYANGVEAPFIRDPYLGPMVLFGARPYHEIENRFMEAHPSKCQALSEAVLPEGLRILPLAGHAADQVGYATADGVYFIADSVVSRDQLDRLNVTYIYDIAEYLSALDRLEKMDAKLFIASHAEPVEDIRPLAEANRAKTLEIADVVLHACEEPACSDLVVQAVCRHYNIRMMYNNFASVSSTLRSYLSYLHSIGEVEIMLKDGLLLWHKKH